MKKIYLLLFCLYLTPALAEDMAAASDFMAYTLADQHGKEHALQPETRTVIMSFDMKLSKGIHEWLSTKDADYLSEHQIPKPSSSPKRKSSGKRSTKPNWEAATIAGILKNETYILTSLDLQIHQTVLYPALPLEVQSQLMKEQ